MTSSEPVDRSSPTERATANGVESGQDRPTLSVVVPIWNEEANIDLLYERVLDALEGIDWQLICVDDGSSDESLSMLRAIRAKDQRVNYISFSRNFGHQTAITAGLDFAEGRSVVVMDADLQDPPEVIPLMLEQWEAGYEVVHAVRSERRGESWFKRWSARVFYRFLRRVTDVDIAVDAGDFSLRDRRVVLELRRLREHHRFMRGLSAWVGFNQTSITYERAERHAGRTKYSLRRMVRLAVNALTSFSFLPLQVASFLGLFLAAASMIVIVVVLILRFVVGSADFLVGQTTTLLAVLFLGGVQLLAIGTIGEYVGRTYDEVRARPLYIVSEAGGFLEPEDDPDWASP